MSKYTTELRWVVEQRLDDLGKDHREQNWPMVYKVIGLDDYPIFEEAHREILNNKIIRHYYTREIGAETVGRFRMFVRDAMNLIMPYYNQLYESELLAMEINPLGDKNMSNKEHAWGNSSAESQSNAASQNVFQDTPQNEMIPAQIKNLQYATNVTMDESEGNGSTSGKYDNMVEKTESGYSRPQSELLQLYRDTFVNIDNDIVHDKELAGCFMTIW